MSEAMSKVYCPHCLHEVAHWLPVQPLYALKDAMFYLMIPTIGAMYTALWRYRRVLGPALYAYDDHHRRHRVLTAEDIRAIRAQKKLSLRGVTRWMLADR